MIVLTIRRRRRRRTTTTTTTKRIVWCPRMYIYIYIYLEPKWPLFWFTRTLFWSGWASKYRTKSFQVHIYIYTHMYVYIYTYNQILHIYCKSSTTLWSILRLRSATKPGAAKGALQGSKTHQSLDLVENGKSCKLCFFVSLHWKENDFNAESFRRGKPLEELGSTSNHSL